VDYYIEKIRELNPNMGIPSYFSYIIKNYPNIIRKFKQCEPFQHLFMDCNSIVYDAFYDIEKNIRKNHLICQTLKRLF